MDGMVRWAMTYLRDVSIPDLLHGDDEDSCAAIIRARRIDTKHTKTASLLKSHPRGRAILKKERGLLRRNKMKPSEAADVGLRVVFEIVLNAAKVATVPDEQRRLTHVHPVFLDHDDVFALSESFEDGSALIRISDSLITACNLLASFNSWRLIASPGPGGAGRSWPIGNTEFEANFEPGLRPGIAALRFYLLRQRVWGNAGKIGLRGAPTRPNDQMLLPTMFIMAHEIAHHVLQHASTEISPQRQELEADDFAFRLLHQINGTIPKAHAQVFAAASVALIALDLHGQGLFIRGPQSHPQFGARWGALRTLLEIPETEVPLAARDLIEAALIAGRTDLPLLRTDWEALIDSPAWDTSLQTEDYIRFVHGLDLSATFTFEQCRDMLCGGLAAAGGADFLPGLTELHAGRLKEAILAWKLSAADLLLDGAQPLGFYSLMETFQSSPLWKRPSAEPDLAARSIALICTNQLLPFLKDLPSDESEHRP